MAMSTVSDFLLPYASDSIMRIGAGAVTALMVSCVPAVATPCYQAPENAEKVSVAEVLAGDRLKLADGRIVRLAGAEVPRGWEKVETQEQAAREALREALGEMSVSVIPVGKAADRHGRWPAHVFAGGRNVSPVLLRAGHLRSRILPGEEACAEPFLLAEREARAAEIGAWSTLEFAIWDARDPSLATRNGLYELVTGTVVSVGTGSRMVFLDFGENYRQDFTVMVPPAVAKALTTQGVALESLSGRSVLVRGVVEESGGPAIRLGHPADIVLLD